MLKQISILLLLPLFMSLTACMDTPYSEKTESGLKPADFHTEIEGKQTNLYVLKNRNGMEVCITNFGGRIVSLLVPDRNGTMRDVVLGFDSIGKYMRLPTDFGATIGRYANRIAYGHLMIDSIVYQLPCNNYGHCLHGGPKGFQYRVFDARQPDEKTLLLSYLSKDGEEGFPGNLMCHVTFKLTDDNALDVRYTAQTDKPTVVNMTNHSYFNLDGTTSFDNSDYLLAIDADNYTPVDSTFKTTGEILPVADTPMDFRKPTPIGAHINSDFIQLKNGLGYDHNWVLNTRGDDTRPCATLISSRTGIVLQVYTNEPGLQVYTGNFLDGTLKGKKGEVYGSRTAVCLETQKFPDTPNKPQWPSAVLRPGEKYNSHCIYHFSVK